MNPNSLKSTSLERLVWPFSKSEILVAEPAILPSVFRESFLCFRIALNFSRLFMFGFPKFLLLKFLTLYNRSIKNERRRSMVVNEIINTRLSKA